MMGHIAFKKLSGLNLADLGQVIITGTRIRNGTEQNGMTKPSEETKAESEPNTNTNLRFAC